MQGIETTSEAKPAVEATDAAADAAAGSDPAAPAEAPAEASTAAAAVPNGDIKPEGDIDMADADADVEAPPGESVLDLNIKQPSHCVVESLPAVLHVSGSRFREILDLSSLSCLTHKYMPALHALASKIKPAASRAVIMLTMLLSAFLNHGSLSSPTGAGAYLAIVLHHDDLGAGMDARSAQQNRSSMLHMSILHEPPQLDSCQFIGFFMSCKLCR